MGLYTPIRGMKLGLKAPRDKCFSNFLKCGNINIAIYLYNLKLWIKNQKYLIPYSVINILSQQIYVYNIKQIHKYIYKLISHFC